MAQRLKDLKITSTDLVQQGANPDAHIRLFKRREGKDGEASDKNLVQKIAASIAEALATVFTKSPADDDAGAVEKDAKTFDDELERERLRKVSCQIWDSGVPFTPCSERSTTGWVMFG